MDVNIRWFIRRDVPEFLDIEQRSFEYAWTEEDLLNTMRRRDCIGMVAESKDKVIGYIFYILGDKFFEIINLCVNPNCRRKGIGTQMVNRLKSKLSTYRRTKVYGYIRETNLVAHQFFKACGFKAERIAQRYFEDSSEDAYLFSYRIHDHADSTENDITVNIEDI